MGLVRSDHQCEIRCKQSDIKKEDDSREGAKLLMSDKGGQLGRSSSRSEGNIVKETKDVRAILDFIADFAKDR